MAKKRPKSPVSRERAAAAARFAKDGKVGKRVGKYEVRAPAYITRPGTEKRPYGVTKAEDRKIRSARAAANRIFALETALKKEEEGTREQANEMLRLRKRLIAALPTKPQVDAMRALCSKIGWVEAVRLGVHGDLLELGRWINQLDGRNVPQSGANALEYMDRVHALNAEKP